MPETTTKPMVTPDEIREREEIAALFAGLYDDAVDGPARGNGQPRPADLCVDS